MVKNICLLNHLCLQWGSSDNAFSELKRSGDGCDLSQRPKLPIGYSHLCGSQFRSWRRAVLVRTSNSDTQKPAPKEPQTTRCLLGGKLQVVSVQTFWMLEHLRWTRRGEFNGSVKFSGWFASWLRFKRQYSTYLDPKKTVWNQAQRDKSLRRRKKPIQADPGFFLWRWAGPFFFGELLTAGLVRWLVWRWFSRCWCFMDTCHGRCIATRVLQLRFLAR